MEPTFGFGVVVPSPASVLSRYRTMRTANGVESLGDQRVEREFMFRNKGISLLPGNIQDRIEFQDITAHFEDVEGGPVVTLPFHESRNPKRISLLDALHG